MIAPFLQQFLDVNAQTLKNIKAQGKNHSQKIIYQLNETKRW